MNEYFFNVNFEKGKIKTDLKELVQNDYNSTKINFTFDKEGRVLFKLVYPDGTFYTDDIENNELVFGNGILCQYGDYLIEISLYSNDGRLTDYATHSFYVRKELVDTDEIVEPDDRVPILDRLINEVNTLESTVNTNETTRQSNEQTRVSNENTRISNEETRQSNETAREEYITDLKQDVEDGKFDGEDGYTPVKGVDYYTEAEREELIDEISSGATSTFNQNVQEKTTAFNNNASLKTDNFNSNAQNKLSEYNSNHTTKLNEYNQNSTDKTTAYNTNATNQTNAYDNNASIKLTAYNDNATEKMSAYNTNHTEKLTAYNDNASDKLDEYNDNAQEKLDDFNDNAEELQNKVDHYKKYSNALVKVSSSGTDLTINDTAECPMEMELEPSEIEQISYEGYSLYDFMNNEYTIDQPSYMSVTKIENGYTITTRNGSTRFGFSGVSVDSSKNYVISFDIEFVSGSGEISIGWYGSSKYMYVGSNGHKAKSFTGITTSYFSIYTPTNSVVNITNLMVYEGTDLTKEYEPYTNGASPNPDYPQDIHTISGDNEIKVINANLYNSPFRQGGETYSSSTRLFSANPTFIKAGTYTFITDAPTTYWFYVKVRIGDSSSSTNVYESEWIKNQKQVFTISQDGYLWLGVRKSDDSSLIPLDMENYIFSLLEGTKNEVVTRKEQTFPLTLGNLEYCKIGDYEDEFVYNTTDTSLELNKWYLKKNILKALPKPTVVNLESNGARFNDYSIGIPIESYPILYCNYFRNARSYNQSAGNLINSLGINSTGIIICNVSGYTTKTEYLNLFTNNDIYVYLPLKNPEYILLNDTLQSQLTEIYEWTLSYQDQTNISQTNDDLPFVINAKACYDLNTVISNLTNAIIELGGDV